MTPTPVVTLVIPCFNQGQYLRECIASLRAQTDTRWRAIVVNDASTDADTAPLCDEVRDGDRVVVLHLDTNHGRCRARNVGIELADTEAIFPLDADDLLRPDHLSKTVPILYRNDSVGFVYSDYEKFGSETGVLRGKPFHAGTMYVDRYVWAGSLFRKSAWSKVGGYDDAFRDGSEDYDLFLSFVEAGYEGVYVDEPLVRYRCHDGSWTNSGVGGSDRDFRARLRLVERHRQGFLSHGAMGAFLADTYGMEADRRARAGDGQGARQMALESFRLAPWKSKSWTRLGRLLNPRH